MQRARNTLENCQAAGRRLEECRTLNVMGLIAMEQKDSSPTERYLLEAKKLATDLNNPELMGKVLNNLAVFEGALHGNYALAQEYYKESYKISKEAGDRTEEGGALGNLGFAASKQGDFEAARSYYEQSLSTSRETGNLYIMIYTHINLSALAGNA